VEKCILNGRRKTNSGHPIVENGRGTTTTAAREAYVKTHGSIPPNHILHHKCGNTSCVNPKHMVALSREVANSLTDMPKNEDHHWAKLSDKQVAYIRASAKSAKDLALQFRCSRSNIYKIRKGIRRP